MNRLQAALLAGSLSTLAATAASANGIKVGSVAGITGPIAELAEPIVAARDLAMAHVNAQGGLLDGQRMQLVLADSQCDPRAGITASDTVVNVEQVVAVIGASCSGATNGMVQSVTIPAGVLTVSDSATAPSLSALHDNDTVFRVAPSDASQGSALARLAFEAGLRRMAVTYANDDYNAGIAAVFAERFAALGGTITAIEVHEPGKSAYHAELDVLAASGEPEALALFAYYGGSGISILGNALESGLFERFYAADGMFDASVIEQIGADHLRDRIVITQSAAASADASFEAFARAFSATGRDPHAPYAAHGYDAAFLVALAIEQAGAAERHLLAAALRAVASPPGEVIRPGEWARAKALIAAGKDIDYQGASGSVDFDGAGDVAGTYGANTVGANGSWVTRLLR